MPAANILTNNSTNLRKRLLVIQSVVNSKTIKTINKIKVIPYDISTPITIIL